MGLYSTGFLNRRGLFSGKKYFWRRDLVGILNLYQYQYISNLDEIPLKENVKVQLDLCLYFGQGNEVDLKLSHIRVKRN